jgi:hypothetical protein
VYYTYFMNDALHMSSVACSLSIRMHSVAPEADILLTSLIEVWNRQQALLQHCMHSISLECVLEDVQTPSSHPLKGRLVHL